MSRWSRALAAVVLIALTVAAAHGGGVNNGWLNYDDPGVVIENPRLDAPGLVDVVEVFGEIRDDAWLPFYYLALMPEASLAGKEPAAFHLASILWHLANALMVLVLFGALTGRRDLGLVAALVFAAHPVTVESVAWVSGRKDQVSLLLLLSGLSFWLGWLRCGGAPRLLAAAFLFLVACFAKGTVVVFPLLAALVWLWLKFRDEPLAVRRPGRATAALFALGLVPVAVHLVIARIEGTAGVATWTALEGALLFLEALGRYATHLLLPFDLSIHYDLDASGAFGMRHVNGLLVLAVLAAGVALLPRRRGGLAGLSLCWIGLSLLPFNDVFPRTAVPMADRYLAVAVPAFGLLVAVILRTTGRAFPILAGLLVLALVFGARDRTRDFVDGETVFRAAMATEPEDALPPHMVATALLDRARETPAAEPLLEEAVGLFDQAVARADDAVESVRSRLPLATTLLGRRRFEAALEHFDAVEALVAEDPELFRRLDFDAATLRHNRAQALLGLDRVLEARELLEALLEEHEGHPQARFTLAQLDVRNGFRALAESQDQTVKDRSRHLVNRGFTAYRELIARLQQPRPEASARERTADRELLQVVLREFGRTLLEASWRSDNLQEALDQAEVLVARFPEEPEGFLLRARVRERVGEGANAVGADLKLAAERDPNDIEVLVRLAQNRLNAGERKLAVQLLRRAQILAPDNKAVTGMLSDVFLSEGERHKNSGDAKKALRAAVEAATLDPENVAAHVLEGEVHESNDDWERADECYGRALSRDPENEAARRGRARYLQSRGLGTLASIRNRLKSVEEAERAGLEQRLRDLVMADFRRALELAPGTEDVRIARDYVKRRAEAARRESAGELRKRARAAMRLGKAEEAEALLRQALRVDGTDATLHAELGMLLLRNKARDPARACFEKALAYDPENLSSLYHLTSIAYVKGDFGATRRYGQRFLDLSGSHAKLLEKEIAAVKSILGRLDG